jgi:hypothetical protein
MPYKWDHPFYSHFKVQLTPSDKSTMITKSRTLYCCRSACLFEIIYCVPAGRLVGKKNVGDEECPIGTPRAILL